MTEENPHATRGELALLDLCLPDIGVDLDPPPSIEAGMRAGEGRVEPRWGVAFPI